MVSAMVSGLVAGLRDHAGCRFADWPGDLAGLESSGLYAWWADDEAAALIAERLEAQIRPGIVYVGQAGALKGRADNQSTLFKRIGADHVGGKIRNSTFRRTAAAILLEELKPFIEGDRKIGRTGERVVTDWLSAHFRVTIVPVQDRARLAVLEEDLLDVLDPPLNLLGMSSSAARTALTARRSVFRGVERASVPRKPLAMSILSSPKTASRPASAITLHDEIAAILVGHANRWLTTVQIAQLVNERARYMKRDGSLVTDYQIHGRTRNYSRLFERDGGRVRLLVC